MGISRKDVNTVHCHETCAQRNKVSGLFHSLKYVSGVGLMSSGLRAMLPNQSKKS